MSRRLSAIGAGLLTALCAGRADAQSTATKGTTIDGKVNTITTAVPFLRISPDARSGGMGDVGIALSPDANAQFWNVGKIPLAEKKYGLSFTATPWLKDLVPDIYLFYLAGYAKFGQENNQAISGSLRYFSLGDIVYTDDGITSTGTGKPREFSLDLGYSRRFSPYLSLGINIRYIHSAIASGLAGGPGIDYRNGNTAAADVGLYYSKTREIDEFRNSNFSFGAVISNLGGKISYSGLRSDFIPINLGLGAAYTSQFDGYNKITFALDVNRLLVPTPEDTSTTGTPKFNPHYDKTVVSGVFGSFSDAPGGVSEELREFNVSAGAEYWYQNQFAVRAGYFWEDNRKGARKYFSCGLGVRFSTLSLNFAYLVPSGSGATRNPLSNTLRASLMWEFDSIKKDEPTEQ